MPVVLQGSLHHFAPSELLVFLGSSAHGGTFDAESGGQRARLALRDGHVVWAEASGTTDPADVVATLLAWSDGTFTFLDEVVLPEGATALALEVAPLIAEAEARMAEARRVIDLYPDDSVRFRVVNRPPGEINITAEEFQILFQIGSGKSLAQLRSDSGRAAVDLYPIIKRLQMTGLVEPAADPDTTAREAAAAPPELVATLTADDGTMHPLLEETSTIGRTASNTIVLRDPSVSARHARIIRAAEGFMIEDVGSRNGTFVNSEKLTGKRLLVEGDLVRLGKIILTFNLASDVQKKQSTVREIVGSSGLVDLVD
ncbi:MAG: FHA domain-containing protein [Acidobacteriota bacterium]|nr:FHA domain-containing protein [Acidobacteriota bacterium]